jgi:hypothetical protein
MSYLANMLAKVEAESKAKGLKEAELASELSEMELEEFRTYAKEANTKLKESGPSYMRAAGGVDLNEDDIWDLVVREMCNRQVGDAYKFIQ